MLSCTHIMGAREHAHTIATGQTAAFTMEELRPILDEMDAIARKRGAAVGDTSGVRDSVVNQLLAKMDGVVEASNVLVIGLTNR